MTMRDPPLDLPCPNCGSTRIDRLRRGEQAGGFIGFLAGAAGAGMRAWRGAEIGAAVGAFAGPGGIATGAILGAVMAALAGGALGGEIGAGLGSALDARLLDNCRCLTCGHTFNRPKPDSS